MKTFITCYENFFRIECASEKRSKLHAFAHIFFERRFNSLFVCNYDIVNVDCTGPAFSCFSRFVVNSSPTYLLSKSSDSPIEIHDNELDFEFENY